MHRKSGGFYCGQPVSRVPFAILFRCAGGVEPRCSMACHCSILERTGPLQNGASWRTQPLRATVPARWPAGGKRRSASSTTGEASSVLPPCGGYPFCAVVSSDTRSRCRFVRCAGIPPQARAAAGRALEMGMAYPRSVLSESVCQPEGGRHGQYHPL